MASIDPRPSGKWRAQVRRTGFPAKSKTFKTKAEAERWARKIEAALDKGVELEAAELRQSTVEDLLDRFLAEEVPHRKGGAWDETRIAYWKTNASWVKQRLDQHLVPALRSYFNARLAEVSAATVNRDMNLLSGVFRVAIKKWGLQLPSNPVHMLARPAVKTKGPGRLWASSDLDAIRSEALKRGASVDGTRLKQTWDYVLPAIELCLESAMRISEVCSLEAGDVDLGGRVALLDETKNGDWRKVPLSTRAVEILRPLLLAAQARLEALPERVGDRAGRVVPMSSDTLGLRFRQLRKAAGITGLRFHDTRHTATTHAVKKLGNILELQAFTGHRSLESLKRYYHADAGDLARKLG